METNRTPTKQYDCKHHTLNHNYFFITQVRECVYLLPLAELGGLSR